MIKWKLKDVMDERGIKSKDLAKEMGITANLDWISVCARIIE